MSASTPIMVIVLIVAAVALLAKAMRGRTRIVRDFTVTRRTFMTARELDAFRMIVAITAHARLHVCPQASMDAFLSFGGEGGFRERGRYKARRSDFVLIDAAGRVVGVIEVDDASHREKGAQDAARDDVVSAAGIPTMRIPMGRLPNQASLLRSMEAVFPAMRGARR